MTTRYVLSAFVFLALIALPAAAADAAKKDKAYYQEQLKKVLPKVELKNLPPKEAFAMLTKLSDVPIDASKVTSRTRVTLMFDKIPANEALLFVCAITGTSPEVTDQGVVILAKPMKPSDGKTKGS